MKDKASILILLAHLVLNAFDIVEIQADKPVYLTYEPLYLTIELKAGNLPRGYFSLLKDEGCGMVLQIHRPDSVEFDYCPPMRLTMPGGMGEDVRVLFAKIILHQGAAVLQMPGEYRLRLFDKEGGYGVSNVLAVTVRKAQTEKERTAVETVSANPGAFGLFMYLEGGDHVQEGMRIAGELAELDSPFRATVSAVLAMNYGNEHYDFQKGKIGRERDYEKVFRYIGRADGACDYLQLQSARTLRMTSTAGRNEAVVDDFAQRIRTRYRGTKYETSNLMPQ